METNTVDWRYLIRVGLIAGAVALYTSAIGMVALFSSRSLISGVLNLGQMALFTATILVGYNVGRKRAPNAAAVLRDGAIVGAVSAVPLFLLLFVLQLLTAQEINYRAMFVNLSPALINLLTFEQESWVVGALLFVLATTVLGVVGAGFNIIPNRTRQALFQGLAWTVGVGLFSELILQMIDGLADTLSFGRDTGFLDGLNGFVRQGFTQGATKPGVAAAIFILVTLVAYWWPRLRPRTEPRIAPPQTQTRRWVTLAVIAVTLLILPWFLGDYLSEVLVTVGLYVLMGLGLNIAVGLAGLLDLGYVVTFAVGAYLMATLTNTGPEKTLELSFWVVIPLCILAAMTTGFVLALPVLRMRGDYLAITTLGFGEIIRLLALSDWLKPLIGGAQGILFIPKPALGSFSFSGPRELYYIILLSCLLVLYISVRLNNSRTGRQWMALREDEDVAKAMGIDTTMSKLLAFTLSAASGGIAGAIFASKLGTIFPSSFNLIISINVLALIIVGGMGSIPGIVLGALVLIGLPELLREFAEYRFLIYGVLLIFMMLARPEGLIPSAIRQRELHVKDDTAIPAGAPGD